MPWKRRLAEGIQELLSFNIMPIDQTTPIKSRKTAFIVGDYAIVNKKNSQISNSHILMRDHHF